MLVIGDLSAVNARRYPDKTALAMGDEALTYAQLDRQSNRLANALLASGVGVGERVALLGLNSLEYAVVLQAVAKCGAIVVPLNFRLAGEDIRRALEDAEPVCLIAEPEFDHIVAEALAGLAAPPRRIALGTPADGAAVSVAGLMAEHPATAPAVVVDPESACMILYTSGTTGRPKGVLMSHAMLFRMFCATAIEARLRQQEVFLLAAPLFHLAGMNMGLNQALFLGASGVVHRGRFEPESIFGLIARHRISLAILVPPTVAALAFHPRVGDYDLASLDKIFYGSMPIAPDVLERAQQVFAGVAFNQIYGSTECGMVGILRPEDHAKWSQATGREALLTVMRIVDDAGRPVPEGEIGELIVDRRTMGMMGYWRNEAAEAEALRGDWVLSGDLARVEPDGVFTIVGRKKETIISGGENIYPKEVEEVIGAHPAVREVAVFGIPDARYGETVCAAVVLREGMAASAADLEAWCLERLARFMRPRRVEFRDALPRNASEKVTKNVLRAPYWAGRSR